MKYLFIEYEEEELWIEVGTDGYASRQVVFDNKKNKSLSCLEDCLAEGFIDESELEGNINYVSKEKFEVVWDKVTLQKRELWGLQKDKYPVGSEVDLDVVYNYPHGWILKNGELMGVCEGEDDLIFGQRIRGTVFGYDETNMWLRISDIK